jgi:transglutaminase-like putative cysteine protease
VAPGDVIEVEWQLSDLDPDPSFPGYFGELVYLQEASHPRAISRLEFVSALPLQCARRGPRTRFRRKPHAARFRGPRRAGTDAPEPLRAGHADRRAYVHVSTLESWTDAGRRYRAPPGGAAIRPTTSSRRRRGAWIGDARTPEEKLRRLHHAVASGVRYVGLELGTHSFQPESPHVTLARAYGDCKDKATLLIALLRAVDVDAQLRAGPDAPARATWPRCRPASPMFDHALVYLPGARPLRRPDAGPQRSLRAAPAGSGRLGLRGRPRHDPAHAAVLHPGKSRASAGS